MFVVVRKVSCGMLMWGWIMGGTLSMGYANPGVSVGVPSKINLQGKRFASPAAKWAWQLPVKFTQLPAKDQKILNDGKIQVELAQRKNERGQDMTVTMVRGIIKRPPAAVFKTMADIEKAPEFMPRMFHSKILQTLSPRVFFVQRKLKIALSTVQMHMRIELRPEQHRYMFSLVHGPKNDVKDVIGAMNFEPVHGGKHTLMTYFNYSDPGRWIPGFIRNSMLRGDLPGIIEAVRKRTISNYTWKKK